MMMCYVFFFKQRTAYEMRISDWSSDVLFRSDVPHQLVARRVEHIMDRDGQLDDAQPRPQMPARRPDGGNGFGAQLVGELAEVFGLQLAKIGGEVHRVEQRRRRSIGDRKSTRPNSCN